MLITLSQWTNTCSLSICHVLYKKQGAPHNWDIAKHVVAGWVSMGVGSKTVYIGIQSQPLSQAAGCIGTGWMTAIRVYPYVRVQLCFPKRNLEYIIWSWLFCPLKSLWISEKLSMGIIIFRACRQKNMASFTRHTLGTKVLILSRHAFTKGRHSH